MQGTEIRAIQQIYSKILNTRIDLPKIVAIGPQSSGKSSVLEQVLQLDFLPRGINMITRCPIVINLRKNDESFVVFQDEEERFTDPKDIQDRIVEKMDHICGDEMGVSKVPVVIYVYLQNTLEITLVDLPGLTKIPVGEQPSDIERQIEEIVVEYASGDSTIILAVVNANVDIGNSEALKIARRVDSKFERTLGVVTKIDLMDEGTDCISVLENKHNPLKMGYIGVLNRSFQDVQNEVPFGEVRKKEVAFFSKPPYCQFKEKIGSVYLLDRLHYLFCENVKKTIPVLKVEINNLLQEKQAEVEKISVSAINPSNVLIQYFNCLHGVVGCSKNGSDLFAYDYENVLYEFKTAFDRFRVEFDFSDIEREIRSSDSLIFHEKIIKDLVKSNSKAILKAGLSRVSKFVRTLKESIALIASDMLPSIASSLNKILDTKIESQEEKLVSDLKQYIKVQGMYINTRYPTFKISDIIEESCGSAQSSPDRNNINYYSKLSFSLKNMMQVEKDTIAKIANKYLEKIQTNFIDHALKSTYFYFINYLKNEILGELISLKTGDLFEKEIEGLEKTREVLEKEIKDLQDSKRIVEDCCIRNF
ncbi:Dynamin-2 [Nosema granulosis]|uniref:Dynamin-2 n=1 Tax=Nosema granulosis TaxID=83296 RepID=A0A9P6KZH9_9MICR|nr:Dynamin-2 [Nosema granulosis]